MDFEFSEEQEQLRDSVRRYLADRAPIAWVRERWADAADPNDAVWKGLAALGVMGLLVPEEHGGAGMTMVDAAVVLEELGRAVFPGPYAASTIGATTLILAAGDGADHAALLPALAAGDEIATVAVFEPGRRYDWRSPGVTVAADGSLTGTKVHVPHGCVAHRYLVTASDASGLTGVYVLDADAEGVHVEVADTIDGGHPEATVELRGAHPARRLAATGTDAHLAIERTFDALGVALCVDGVGTAARALELSVEYAQQRYAFGRPIGSFQAVQHLCADMLRAVELARAAGYYACWALDSAERAEGHRAATVARAYCAESLPQLGGTAVQVFAGIGFTWEHDVHLYYKRLVHLGYALGSADEHLATLAGLVID